MSDGRYYLMLECDNCEKEILYGPCYTTLKSPRGVPVIPISAVEQVNFECECGTENYTGDIDIFVEGGPAKNEDSEDVDEDEEDIDEDECEEDEEESE